MTHPVDRSSNPCNCQTVSDDYSDHRHSCPVWLAGRGERLSRENYRLRTALLDLYNGTAEYVYLNNLGDPHNTTPMQNAAEALGVAYPRSQGAKNLLDRPPSETNGHQPDAVRAALQAFMDFQISDYYRQAEAARRYCEIRKQGRAALTGPALKANEPSFPNTFPAHICRHGKDWLTCPECAKAAVNGDEEVK